MRALVALAVAALVVPSMAADNDARAPAHAAAGDPPAALPATCAARVAAGYEAVARNVYAQAVSGRAPAAASARLTRSPALVAAVAADDPRAARRALVPLLRGQIKRIAIARGGRTLVALGHAPALAPVSGSVGGATFTLSVATTSGIASIVHELSGERVTLRPGAGAVPVTEFPAGVAHLALSGHPPCGSVTASVARRLLHGELAGPHTRHVVGLVGNDPRFARAVAADDPTALRAQIVRFFRDPRLHVVRIRATRHGRLVNDVGGPDVLAPASGPVDPARPHGRPRHAVDPGRRRLPQAPAPLHRRDVALTGTQPLLRVPRFPAGTLEVFARGPTTL